MTVCLVWCTVILITCPRASAPLVVDSTLVLCYIVLLMLLHFCWYFADLLIYPHRVGVPCFLQFDKVILKAPSCIKFLILDVFRGFTITVPLWVFFFQLVVEYRMPLQRKGANFFFFILGQFYSLRTIVLHCMYCNPRYSQKLLTHNFTFRIFSM